MSTQRVRDVAGIGCTLGNSKNTSNTGANPVKLDCATEIERILLALNLRTHVCGKCRFQNEIHLQKADCREKLFQYKILEVGKSVFSYFIIKGEQFNTLNAVSFFRF